MPKSLEAALVSFVLAPVVAMEVVEVVSHTPLALAVET